MNIGKYSACTELFLYLIIVNQLSWEVVIKTDYKPFHGLRPTWRVRERAEALGLTIEDVQFGARITRLQAEAFWQAKAQQIHIETLARLGHILQTTNINDFLSLESWDVREGRKAVLQDVSKAGDDIDKLIVQLRSIQPKPIPYNVIAEEVERRFRKKMTGEACRQRYVKVQKRLAK